MRVSTSQMTLALFLVLFGHAAVAFFPPSRVARTSVAATKNSSFPSTYSTIANLSSRLHVSSPNKEDNELMTDSTTVGVILLSTFSNLGVFWSEAAVFQTGCGPLSMPNWLERSAYLGVLIVSGLSLFWRIVTFGDEGLASIILGSNSSSSSSSVRNSQRVSLQVVETLTFLAVSGAVLVLANQALNGEIMDGLSGIDLEMCAARQAFLTMTS